jgi:hypothetical protein
LDGECHLTDSWGKQMNATTKFAVFIALLTYCTVANAKDATPLVALSGDDSKIHKASYQRVTSPDDWAQIWSSHLGTSVDDSYRSCFEVDFERCMVVAILRGEQRNSRGIRVDSIENAEDALVIRFTQLGYQTSGVDNDQPPDRPFAFIVVPATSKTIVFEENYPNTMGTPPEWKEVARMEGQEVIPDKP